MSARSRIRIKITKVFKRNGLKITKDAAQQLLAYLEPEETWDEKEAKAEDVITRLKDRKLESDKITVELLEPILQQAEGTTDDAEFALEEPLQIIDSFSSKDYWRYQPVQKKFVKAHTKGLHSDAKAKTAVFCDRYEILLQRILRNDSLRHASEGKTRVMSNDQDVYEITTTQNLLGEEGNKCIFGILCEIEEGKVHLEDTHGSIEVDITDVELDRDTGFYTYNSFVLAEGEMVEGVFKVNVLAFPPYESRAAALDVHPNLSPFSTAKKAHILKAEKEQIDENFVFLSNVYLDVPRVRDALAKLFEGYEDMDQPPGLFVLMGNFTKERLGSDPNDIPKLRKLFDMLCDIICKHSRLVKLTQWVFLPGPKDPSAGNVLPRKGLFKVLTYKLRNKLRSYFPSNPCRIRYYTQEILVYREDLQSKLRRNTVLPCELKDSEDLSNHLVKTILDQAHLCPLPLIVQPIHWSFDHALRLYPPPTCVVLGDSHAWYKYTYMDDCDVVNPGEFNVDFSFVLYSPATREFDYSMIPE